MTLPRLAGPRVALVPVTQDVAVAVVAGAGVPAALAPLGLEPGAGWPHADTADALRMYAEHGSDDVPGVWVVALRDTEQVIGDCGWYGPPGAAGEVEIGYGMSPAFRGNGYATEAVRALLGWIRAYGGVRRVVAETEVTNTPSRRLLERLAFTVTDLSGASVRYALPVRGPRPAP